MVPLSLLPGRGEEVRGAWKIGITDCMPLLGGELRRLNVCKIIIIYLLEHLLEKGN